MTTLVAAAIVRPVVSVLKLNGENGLGEVSGTQVQLADPLLDGDRTEDVEAGGFVRVLKDQELG